MFWRFYKWFYLDFIGSYLLHKSHLTYDDKIEFWHCHIVKWTLPVFNSNKIGPLIHAFTYLWAKNLQMNNEFFEQKDSEKLVMHEITWYTCTQKV
jgi:hypothetical protein